MAHYAFFTPIRPGKAADLKRYVAEMTGPRKKEFVQSRKRLGLKEERVWLQKTPAGEFAVVFWEADDIGKVFHDAMTSHDPFDKWFREKILVDVHGMSLTSPPPPMNDVVLDYSA